MNRSEFSPRRLLIGAGGALLVLLVILLAYVSLHRLFGRVSQDYFYPWFRVLKSTENLVTKTSGAVKFSRLELTAAVEKLQRDNAELAAQTAALRQAGNENIQLRSLLQLRAPVEYRPVFAEVLLRDPITWDETFTVDRGTADGIREGDLAVAMLSASGSSAPLAAAVGRVTAVSLHTATIATLYNPECTFSVTLAESAGHGLMRGAGGGINPQIGFLPVAAQYGAGEIIMTSGYSEQTPPGIYVGTLARRYDGSVAKAVGHLYAEAEATPAVNIGGLRFIAVLTRRAQP